MADDNMSAISLRSEQSHNGASRHRGDQAGIAFSLLPAVLLFLLAYVAPLATLIVTAFSEWSFLGFEWTGTDNIARLTSDSTFWRAATNTSLYTLGAVLIQLPLSIAAGVILSWHLPGWKVFRAVLFLPVLISGAAFALTYLMFYNPSYGLLNELLGIVGLDDQHDWLFDLTTALPAVMATYVFLVGFGMILIMGEIVGIPLEFYEAARVDGASRLQQVRYVTLPMIRHVIGTAALLGILASLRLFDVVYIMTRGGPADNTTTFGVYGYSRYVADQWGYGNTIGLATLAIGAVVILVVNRIFRIGETLD